MNTVQNSKKFLLISKSWLKKSICVIGLTGISILISRPILAFECPLAYLFGAEIYSDVRTTDSNLYDALKEDTNFNFNNLVHQIKKNEQLVSELINSNYTLLAFDDNAFNELESDISDKFKDEKLRDRILRHHIIKGRATPEELEQKIISTLSGDRIKLSLNSGDVMLNDSAKAECRPIYANEGLIIKINKVLVPSNLLQE